MWFYSFGAEKRGTERLSVAGVYHSRFDLLNFEQADSLVGNCALCGAEEVVVIFYSCLVSSPLVLRSRMKKGTTWRCVVLKTQKFHHLLGFPLALVYGGL